MADSMTMGQNPDIYSYLMGGMGQRQYQPQQQGNFLSALTQSVPAIMSGFGAMGKNSAYNNMNQLGNQANSISSAMGDLNNPLYQKLYGQYKQQDINNLVAGTNALSGQNRMLSSMGRVPLFARGREGEQNFRQLMGGYQNSDLMATNQARDALMQNLNATNSAYGMQRNLAEQQNSKNAQGLGAFGSIASLLGRLF